jgi:hypothetical protein
MSFLYPLLLAGIAAIGLPILLHMIRRHTREHVTFSSLMFLRTTLPRFRHRSRIEHWLLLFVRCLIICLLAIAFARPFLRQPPAATPSQPGKRIVVLMDTSASMRRAGLWDQALREARSALAAAGPADRVCVLAFDRTTRTVAGFDQWQAIEPSQRATTVASQCAGLSPGWAATNMGQALVAAAEAIEDDEANDQNTTRVHQVVLISDLQQGSNLEALAAYEWPRNIELSVRPLPAQGKTDAAIQLVTGRDYLSRLDDIETPSIRVTNSAEAATQRFQLRWADGAGDATDVYVPSGGSAVVKAPPRPAASPATSRLLLTGDDQDFDNALYVTPPLQQPIDILYIGNDDPNDSKALLFYLRQAFGAAGALNAKVTQCRSDQPWPAAQVDNAQLVIVTGAMDLGRIETVRRALDSGRTGLFVLKSDGAATNEKYAMLARMELTHPLLAPFADPKFGDFTRIHFWKYVRVRAEDIPNARVLAWFDTNDPAILEIPSGRGSLLMFTSGWHPADSDLALSSKFVPLLYSILEYGGTLTGQRPQYAVEDSVPLPAWAAADLTNVQIRKPDNSLARLDSATFTATDVPGIYTIESPRQSQPFAVNLAASECRTDPMPVEDLEKLGLPVAGFAANTPKTGVQGKQAADFAVMESHQKLWRWVIVAVLGIVFLETWLAERVRVNSKPAAVED